VLTSDEARELFDGLIALLEEQDWQGRFAPLVAEVRAAIARGKPAEGEVSFAGKKKREVVRRVEPFGALEQLEILVGALEFALVTPVDLANVTTSVLATEEMPVVDLVFERESAGASSVDLADLVDLETGRIRQPDASDGVLITASEIRDASQKVEPLRVAIRAIQTELAR
jgi:hypothetical protein